MIGELKSNYCFSVILDETDQDFDEDEESKSMIWELSAIRGPSPFTSPEIKPRGDVGLEKGSSKAINTKKKIMSQT